MGSRCGVEPGKLAKGYRIAPHASHLLARLPASRFWRDHHQDANPYQVHSFTDVADRPVARIHPGRACAAVFTFCFAFSLRKSDIIESNHLRWFRLRRGS